MSSSYLTRDQPMRDCSNSANDLFFFFSGEIIDSLIVFGQECVVAHSKYSINVIDNCYFFF